MKIRANVLVNSKEYVREPVDKEVNEILSSQNNKFILTGGRGIGKSTVLCELEKRGLGSNEQTIYCSPDNVICFAKEPNDRFNTSVFDYYAELSFSFEILLYIKRNYPILFRNHFKKDMELVDSLYHAFIEQINNSTFKDINIECMFRIKELFSNILSKLQQLNNIEKINIAIDRFDKINGSSEYSQKTYEKYFDMFNKVILTSDDPNLDADRLLSNGYDLRYISYGNDKDVLGEIIRRRIQQYENNVDENKSKHIISGELFTTDYFLDKLSCFDGNIDYSLEALRYFIQLLGWYDKDYSIGKILDEAIAEKSKSHKDFERILSKPTLYL